MFTNPSDNLVVLLDVWTRRATGHLCGRACVGRGTERSVFAVVEGGLVHPEDWTALYRAVADHMISFDPSPVAGQGDRRALAGVVALAARRHRVPIDTLVQETRPAPRSSSDPSGLLLLPGLPLALDLGRVFGQSGGLSEHQNVLLTQGIAHATAGRWAEADMVLSRARDQRFDSPRVLAWLAWTRLNNPTRALAERTRDAQALILMAEQLAPNDAEVSARARAIRQEALATRTTWGAPTSAARAG